MEAKQYVNARIETLRRRLEERELDAALLVKPENVFYFSGFNPVLNSHPVFVIITRQSACLLVHSIRCDHAREEGALDTVHLYGKWGASVPLAQKPVDAVREILGGGPLRLGLELDSVSVKLHRDLSEALDIAGVQDLADNIRTMKIVKDACEIENIRKAARLVDAGVKTAIRFLEQGRSEAEACTEGQYRMRRIWSEEFPQAELCGFGTSEGGMIDSLHVWCLSNAHIAYGCDCPRHYHPVAGDLTLPMAWAKVNGYHAENERTVAVGQLSGVRERAYAAMLEARQAVFDLLRPGVLFEELYEKAAGVYTAHGFGDILPGRVGHGVGNSAHEFPSLERGNKIPLAPGMVITVEPGLMDKRWGGARHSDTVLITGTGYERLTALERGPIRIDPPAAQ